MSIISNKWSLVAIGVFSIQSLSAQKVVKGYPLVQRLNSFKEITLTTDTAKLSEAEKRCIMYLIEAAKSADEIFWKQTYMAKKDALKGIKNDTLKRFLEINYGPWDRLNNDKPFMAGVGEKPKGVNYYPADFDPKMVTEDIKARVLSPYTVIKNSPKIPVDPGKNPPKEGEMMAPMEMFPLKNGNMVTVEDFGFAYNKDMRELIASLEKAAEAIEPEDAKFAQFLRMRGGAIMTNNLIMSDIDWLNLNSHLDIIIGPIENYEDKLTGQKTAFEAYVLVRDVEWGERLKKYIGYLPELQAGLPVDAPYKPELAKNEELSGVDEGTVEMIEEPGFPPMLKPKSALSQLAVFDVVYYGGDCNSGSKTIAVNLPNDETIQKYFGTRRSQLKNAMKAKFDEIVMPISKTLIVSNQQANIKFDAFFANVMFHEVAHGLGVKNLVSDASKTVREALGPDYSAIEECKADVLGLYMVTKLVEKGELSGKLDDYYVTFVASVFRSVRFGASSAHGKANMITFNTLLNKGAITKGPKGYSINVNEMKNVIGALAAELLVLQGDGNTQGVTTMLTTRGVVTESLNGDLAKLQKANIPVDLTFKQGIKAMGLERLELNK
jgi:hypothetical protein